MVHYGYQKESLILDEEKGEWNFRSGNYMNLSKEKYPEVTFENSPKEVELVIKK